MEGQTAHTARDGSSHRGTHARPQRRALAYDRQHLNHTCGAGKASRAELRKEKREDFSRRCPPLGTVSVVLNWAKYPDQ